MLFYYWTEALLSYFELKECVSESSSLQETLLYRPSHVVMQQIRPLSSHSGCDTAASTHSEMAST